MPDQVKYAVAGAGAIAQRRHLPEGHANPKSTIVGITDPVEERVRSIAERYDAKAYTDYRAMLDDTDADAVVVATPNGVHAEQTIAALEAGFHVLVEKPMATTRDEARAMIAAAEKSGKYLMIGMNQRLMPAHAKAKQVLDTGALGRVLTFETNFKHAGPEFWSVDGAESWFFRKAEAGLGVNGDLGIHKADLMRFLLGEEFTQVGGFVDTLEKKGPDGDPLKLDDNAFLHLKTTSGIIGSIHIAWTNYGRIEDNGTQLYCENGAMRIGMDPTYGVMVDYLSGQKERYVVGEMATNTKQVASGVIDSFTRCILSGTPPTINGAEGYKALDVILTAVEASKEGTFKSISP